MKPIASLSLDLDNEWSYLKTHGDLAWQTFPSYLPLVVPRFLDFLARRGLRISVFVVGQDAAFERNYEPLRAIAGAGHEIGNHSFHHEPWLHTYSENDIAAEIDRAAEAIEAATGARPLGFRGPGYSLSRATLDVLLARGYRYDCTTLPTCIGPLARAYYFMNAKLSPDERRRRRMLFGSMSEGLRSLRPYAWELGGGKLTEMPVTTFPLLKVPIHFSYILALATISPGLALGYFRAALGACRLRRIAPSLLLHPLDFLDGDEVGSLSFFPAMRMGHARKLALLDRAFDAFQDLFEVVGVGEHAAAVAAAARLRPTVPRFG
jgi:hypothetical protein